METLFDYEMTDGVSNKRGHTITVILNDEGTHVNVHGVPYLETRVSQAQDPKTGRFPEFSVETAPVLKRGETLEIRRDENDRVVITKK